MVSLCRVSLCRFLSGQRGSAFCPRNIRRCIANMVVGYILFRVGKLSPKNKAGLYVFFAGVVVCSVMLSFAFVDKMH